MGRSRGPTYPSDAKEDPKTVGKAQEKPRAQTRPRSQKTSYRRISSNSSHRAGGKKAVQARRGNKRSKRGEEAGEGSRTTSRRRSSDEAGQEPRSSRKDQRSGLGRRNGTTRQQTRRVGKKRQEKRKQPRDGTQPASREPVLRGRTRTCAPKGKRTSVKSNAATTRPLLLVEHSKSKERQRRQHRRRTHPQAIGPNDRRSNQAPRAKVEDRRPAAARTDPAVRTQPGGGEKPKTDTRSARKARRARSSRA